MMKRLSATIRAGVLAAGLACTATAASAATVNIDFAGNQSPTESKEFTQDGITVTAQGARLLLGLFVFGGTVTQTLGGGLGVGGSGLVIDTNNEIDGLGFNDTLILTFSSVVSNVSSLFRAIDLNGSDDWDVFVDDGSGIFTRVLDDGTINPFVATGLVKRIAYLADQNNDDFRVRSVQFDTVTAVPLPAAGWLLLSAFGGLAALRRRQRAA